VSQICESVVSGRTSIPECRFAFVRCTVAYLHVRHARQYTAHRAAGCHSSIALWASPGHSLHAALCSTQTSELTAVVCTAQRKLGNCFDSN
jgi:hypothetical protein